MSLEMSRATTRCKFSMTPQNSDEPGRPCMVGVAVSPDFQSRQRPAGDDGLHTLPGLERVDGSDTRRPLLGSGVYVCVCVRVCVCVCTPYSTVLVGGALSEGTLNRNAAGSSVERKIWSPFGGSPMALIVNDLNGPWQVLGIGAISVGSRARTGLPTSWIGTLYSVHT